MVDRARVKIKVKHMKIYLASPMDKEYRENTSLAAEILRKQGHEVYVPAEHKIFSAWEYPNAEWGEMVFTCDIESIRKCDCVVGLNYGRMSPAGSNWELGFAYGIQKKIIIVEMNNEIISLMVTNGRYATVKWLNGLRLYDWEHMPMVRNGTNEQK